MERILDDIEDKHIFIGSIIIIGDHDVTGQKNS